MSKSAQGHLIRQARTDRQVTVEDLATRTGISAEELQGIEGGSRPATAAEAILIADALGASEFDFYPKADNAYLGNRSVRSGPILGHEFERLAEQDAQQRDQSERESKQEELDGLDSWYRWATPDQHAKHARRVRRMRELRQELHGSPTGLAGGQAAQQPQKPVEMVLTSRGYVPVVPIGEAS